MAKIYWEFGKIVDWPNLPLYLTEIYKMLSFIMQLLFQIKFVQTILSQQLSVSAGHRRSYVDFPSDVINKLLYLECKTYLTSLLIRQDKMSMAASVESRVPFLDFRIVETAFKIPSSKRFPLGNNKKIIKKLAQHYLPTEVITRRKCGFAVPIGTWLRDRKNFGRYLDLITDESFRSRGYFDTKIVGKLVNEHLSNRFDHCDILWELINFEMWHRIIIDKTIRI